MPEALFGLFGQPVTAYALAMSASAALCCAYCVRDFRKAGLADRVADRFLLLAIPLCMLLARAFYVLARLPMFLDRPDGLAFRLWQGGYAVWGALAGFFLAGWGAAKLSRLKAGDVLGAAAPAGMLMIALGRFCEGLAGQGFGHETYPALPFFPLAVVNEWGERRWAVFMFEGAAALLYLWKVRAYRGRPGDRALYGLTLVCASQIVFESLREDEFLAWGFVRVGQVVPAALLLLLLAAGLRRGDGFPGLKRHEAAGFVLAALGVAGIEFALDKTAVSPTLLYSLMAACAAGMYALVKRVALKGAGE